MPQSAHMKDVPCIWIETAHGDCRVTMERLGQLEPRISVLEDDFDEEALEAEADNAEAAAVSPPAWLDRGTQHRTSLSLLMHFCCGHCEVNLLLS